MPSPLLSRPLRLPDPAAPLRRVLRRWTRSRLAPTDTQRLVQRNIYILPTRAGLVYALTLLVLLVASINYRLNLGYLLTFLLAGSGLASMHLTHATLRGLTLRLRPPAPAHAGEAAGVDVVLASPDAARWGVGVGLEAAGDDTLAWTDVPAGGEAALRIGHVPAQRGLHGLPLLRVETRFPLGLFRAWTLWQPASRLLVYPAPERPAAPLPGGAARAGEAAPVRGAPAESAEFDGVRGWRRGDPLRQVVWKKAATALATGGELVSREHAPAATTARLQLRLARLRRARRRGEAVAAGRLGARRAPRRTAPTACRCPASRWRPAPATRSAAPRWRRSRCGAERWPRRRPRAAPRPHAGCASAGGGCRATPATRCSCSR